ncbi:MAG: hypothetical protein FD124_3097, partial [Alphaproteobacteria bacterium]
MVGRLVRMALFVHRLNRIPVSIEPEPHP